MAEVPEGITLSSEDEARLATEDYVYDPVFGVQPKDVETGIRLRREAREAGVLPSEQAKTVVEAPAVTTRNKPQDTPPVV